MSVPQRSKFATQAHVMGPLANAAGYADFYTAAADILNVRQSVVRITLNRDELDSVKNSLALMIKCGTL